MMSENPENRMPLSHPARSVDAAPPDPAFERAFGGRVGPLPPRPGRDVFDADAEAAPFAGFAPRAALAGLAGLLPAADVPAVAVFEGVGFELVVGAPFGAPLGVAPVAASDFDAVGAFDGVGFAFAGADDAAERFAADAAASDFDVPGTAPGRPGTAGRRGTPDERGGRGASGCMAPPHRPGKGERGRPHGRPRHDLSLLRP
jgi:hypothetical protein